MAAGEQNRGRRQRPTARKTAAAKPAKAKPGARATGAGRPPSRTRPLPCELTLAVMEGAVEGVIIAERQSGKIRYANATAGRMFACSPAELAGGNISSLHPKENLAAVRQVFDAQGRGESSLSKSIPCQRRDGSVFWADISTARLLLHDTPCIIGFFSDVTGQKAARDEIEEAHALFSGDAPLRLQHVAIREIVVTDTLPIPPARRLPTMHILSIAPMLAAIVRNIHAGESISSVMANPKPDFIVETT